MIRILISARPFLILPPLSIPNITMASIMRNVVHWGSYSQRQKTPVPVDLCEVFHFTTLFNGFGVDFVQRSVAKSQNLLTKVSSIHTAVGAAHGTGGRGLVQLPVYFVDVVQQASLRLPISVQKRMPGMQIYPSLIICR